MLELTYAQLDHTLRSLGFSVHLLEGNGRGYQHQASGARVTLPNVSGEDKVLPRHLMAVRTILKAFAIPEPAQFASQVTRAS